MNFNLDERKINKRMKNFIICHYGKEEYIYDFEKNKFYQCSSSIKCEEEENSLIVSKLKGISSQFEWRLDDKYNEILEKTYIAHSMRKHYRFDLYQTPVLPESSLRRALQVSNDKQKVVLVGDDDLVSVPLALLGHDVTVIDADYYLIELIKKLNSKMNVNIKTICCDLSKGLDAAKFEKYDVLFSDPVSTREGYEVFVGNGMQILKENGCAYITVTERFSPVLEKFLDDYNFKIIKRYRAFCNSYNHKFELIDDVADMVQVCKTERTHFGDADRKQSDFFDSQKQMRFSLNVEYHVIDKNKIDKQIQEVIEKISKADNFTLQYNKYILNDCFYYLVYDEDTKIRILINVYEDYVEFCFNFKETVNISEIKRAIDNIISYKTIREEQYVCGLSLIKGHMDLNVNYIK